MITKENEKEEICWHPLGVILRKNLPTAEELEKKETEDKNRLKEKNATNRD